MIKQQVMRIQRTTEPYNYIHVYILINIFALIAIQTQICHGVYIRILC